MSHILTGERLEAILTAIPRLTIGVLGDLFLDRYLDLDAALTEPSLETGLDAYQVTQVRAYPGAAGTVINNLAALGVGRIIPISVIGRDGEGYELRAALTQSASVDTSAVLDWPSRRTPTYTKPMLCEPGRPPRELNRLDIHNRAPLPPDAEKSVLALLEEFWSCCDALAVLDQVSLPECGVVTSGVRAALEELASRTPQKPVLADSRERIGLFRAVSLKPNARESLHATQVTDPDVAVRLLCRNANRPVYSTRGERGIVLVESAQGPLHTVPGYAVRGPVDPVGAGDSTTAGILCALAAGASHQEAAAFGNLVASITVQQIGVTGTATPEQVRQRWDEVA